MEKKGELTSTQIIIIVLAIVGFGLVAIALFLVDFGGYTEKDICKLSVLSRATATNVAGMAGAGIPLKCRTEKICLSESFFGGCDEQFAGEENIVHVRLSGSSSNKARQIMEISANAMYDCWTMMGEGRLDLFKDNIYGATDATCVVCSRVAIDKSVGADVYDLVNVDNYMKNTQVPGSQYTYLQTFTDRSVVAYAIPLNDSSTSSYKNATLSGNQFYDVAYVFSQIKSSTVVNTLKSMAVIGGTAGAATFMTPILGSVAKKMILTPAGLVVTGVAAAGAAGYGTYRAIESQKAAAGYCGKYASGGTQKDDGCSVVQAVPYTFRDVNAVCGAIQGEL